MLTASIKQELAYLNGEISQLQASASYPSDSAKQHSNSVVVSLQTQLANASMGFKNVLETTNQTIKEQKQRREEYSFADSSVLHSRTVANSKAPSYDPNDHVTVAMENQQLLIESVVYS